MKASDQRPKTKGKFEHSAGGVIYRKLNRETKILLIQDKKDNWSFPKGLIEQREDPIETAKREIVEEVGLQDLVYIDTIDAIRYFYRFEGSLVRKKVEYYLFEYKDRRKPIPQGAEGIKDAQWFDPKEALAIIGYAKTNRPILEKAIKIISND